MKLIERKMRLRKELTMRSDRSLLASAAFLAAGLSTIFFYGTANSGISAALPWSNSTFHLSVLIDGPGAIGGVALTILGVLFLIWAILGAFTTFLTSSGKAKIKKANQSPQSPPQPSQFNQ